MLPGSPHGNADGLVERIVEALLRRILHGDFAPNERLRQDDLAREFAVSQGTMREAFRKLEAQRLLESLPRRGVRVTALDAATEREVAAMRGALEVLAVRSIARPPGKDHLKFLESVLRRGDAAQDLFESEAANREFHVGLAKPCGMPRLIASIDADRFDRAGRLRYRGFAADADHSAYGLALVAALAPIDDDLDVTTVPALRGAVAQLEMPVAIFGIEKRDRFGPPVADDVPPKPEEIAVAFLEFMIDGKPADTVHSLSMGEVHDLDLTIRVSRWSEGAERLVIELVSIEPPDFVGRP